MQKVQEVSTRVKIGDSLVVIARRFVSWTVAGLKVGPVKKLLKVLIRVLHIRENLGKSLDKIFIKRA